MYLCHDVQEDKHLILTNFIDIYSKSGLLPPHQVQSLLEYLFTQWQEVKVILLQFSTHQLFHDLEDISCYIYIGQAKYLETCKVHLY